jgi:hypothetical protein
MNIKLVKLLWNRSMVAGVLLAVALVPLPDFAGGTTGVKLAYNIMAANHITGMSDWVLTLDDISNKKDDNGERINSIQMQYYIHGTGKPKRYEFSDPGEYHEEMENWRTRGRDLINDLNKLKGKRAELIQARLTIAKNSPIKQHWQQQ